jgi:hypothetical protein
MRRRAVPTDDRENVGHIASRLRSSDDGDESGAIVRASVVAFRSLSMTWRDHDA